MCKTPCFCVQFSLRSGNLTVAPFRPLGERDCSAWGRRRSKSRLGCSLAIGAWRSFSSEQALEKAQNSNGFALVKGWRVFWSRRRIGFAIGSAIGLSQRLDAAPSSRRLATKEGARPPRDVGRERGRESEERDPLGLDSSRRAGHVPLSSAPTATATPSSGTYNFIPLVTLTREASLH